MDATIVIPVKNGGEKLAKVLSAIEEQKTEYEYEIVCVDSGSDDNSIDIIKEHNCILKEIPSSEFGHGKTRNLGASMGTGRYILFLTQDALPASNTWLENMLSSMDRDDTIAGGFGKHIPYPDCNLPDRMMLQRHFANFGQENHVFKITDDNRNQYENDEGYKQYLAFFSDNNSCLRRSVWDSIPYDDVSYAEDQFWARKILEAGYGKLYCPGSVVYHSHNYPLSEYKKRYFDDFRAVYRVYGRPKNGKGMISFKDALSITKEECRYIRKQSDLAGKSKIYWYFYSLRRNMIRHNASYRAYKYFDLTQEQQHAEEVKLSQQYIQKKG
jgi:rhamnosyltransferase